MRRTSIFVESLLVLTICSSALIAQSRRVSVPVIGPSESNCPFAVSGAVVLDREVLNDHVESQWSMRVELTNKSPKPIMAYEVSVVGGGVNHVAKEDYFFRPSSPLVPGEKARVDFDSPPIEQNASVSETPLRIPGARLTVLFVEFDDGSEYGSSNWGDTLSETRKWTIRKFQEVLSLFQQSEDAGREALENELTRDNPAITVAGLNEIREILNARGANAAAARIEERLTAAQERSPLLTEASQ